MFADTLDITPEFLTACFAVIISLACSYIPGLKDKWATLQPEQKRLIMAGVLLLLVALLFGLSCWNILPSVPCGQVGIVRLAWCYLLAIIANQSAYAISKPSKRKEWQPSGYDKSDPYYTGL